MAALTIGFIVVAIIAVTGLAAYLLYVGVHLLKPVVVGKVLAGLAQGPFPGATPTELAGAVATVLAATSDLVPPQPLELRPALGRKASPSGDGTVGQHPGVSEGH